MTVVYDSFAQKSKGARGQLAQQGGVVVDGVRSYAKRRASSGMILDTSLIPIIIRRAEFIGEGSESACTAW